MYLMKRGHMNKKGLDAIVTTVIIILLAIVAIAIIWSVVRSVVQDTADSVAANSKCISVNVKGVGVVESPAGTYAVTLKRETGGEALSGILVAVVDANGNAKTQEWGDFAVDALDPLETDTENVVTNPAIAGATKIEITPYFEDASGKAQPCSTVPFTF